MNGRDVVLSGAVVFVNSSLNKGNRLHCSSIFIALYASSPTSYSKYHTILRHSRDALRAITDDAIKPIIGSPASNRRGSSETLRTCQIRRSRGRVRVQAQGVGEARDREKSTPLRPMSPVPLG